MNKKIKELEEKVKFWQTARNNYVQKSDNLERENKSLVKIIILFSSLVTIDSLSIAWILWGLL